MLGYLSADIICSGKRTVFRERSSRKTVSFEEQIISKDKYPCIFLRKMEAIVFVILQIFFALRVVLKIGEYHHILPGFRWGIFGHVTRLDQLRAGEKYLMDYKMAYFSSQCDCPGFWNADFTDHSERELKKCQEWRILIWRKFLESVFPILTVHFPFCFTFYFWVFLYSREFCASQEKIT